MTQTGCSGDLIKAADETACVVATGALTTVGLCRIVAPAGDNSGPVIRAAP